MKSRVVCLASAKGGSGKTIVTASFASFLSAIGKKCLMIDCDAATHGLTLLYVVETSAKSGSNRGGIFDLLDTTDLSEKLDSSIIQVENGVDFLPATYNFRVGFDPEENFEQNCLSRVVNLLRVSYDFIILDAQAGSDKYSRLAMSKDISDEVVIVSEYDPLSAAGIERLKRVVGDDLDYTRTWILLNKVLPEFVEKFSEFLSVARYLPPIVWSADVVRAYAKRKLALELEFGNVFTLSILRTLSVLLGDEVKNEIKHWTEKRSYALRAPLEKQYSDAAEELTFTTMVRRNLRRKRLVKRMWQRIPILVTGILAVTAASSSIGFGLLEKSVAEMLISPVNVPDLLVAIGTFIIFISAVGALFYVFLNFITDDLVDPEDVQYRVRVTFLEEKLRQLEALKSASLDEIIKNRGSG